MRLSIYRTSPLARTDNRKWLLARLHAEKYGDRLQASGNAGGGAVININLPTKGGGSAEPAAGGARVTIEGHAVDVEGESGFSLLIQSAVHMR